MKALVKRARYYNEQEGWNLGQIVDSWDKGFGLETEVRLFHKFKADLMKRYGVRNISNYDVACSLWELMK